jgi:hypothetical protein
MYDDAAAEQQLMTTQKYGASLTVLAAGAKISISIEITNIAPVVDDNNDGRYLIKYAMLGE